MEIKTHVLVVDDDPKIRRLVSVNLERRGHVVTVAEDGDVAISKMEIEWPDLVILDLAMPGKNGNQVCRWIRKQSDIPIIVLTAYDEEDMKVQALDDGADDYVTKPFGQEEFMARVRAVLRRANTSEGSDNKDSKIKIGEGITIDLRGKRAFVEDEDMHLTRTEFALLSTLAQNPDAVLSHDELLAKVWGVEYQGSNHYLHVYFGRIRKKIGDKYNGHLETVAGLGYILHSTLPR
jgi:two-component system, OmpR family, KDP operon response regulator KdpE